MKILYMGNNQVGYTILRFLLDLGEDIVGLVIHPDGKEKYGWDLTKPLEVYGKNIPIIDGSKLREPDILQQVKDLEPDLGLSIFFAYIFKQEFIDIFPRGIINLHRSYLPYNRGMYTNVWGIIDRTPTGATLHYVNAGIDTGPILFRKELSDEPHDTGETLYRKQEELCIKLFKSSWPIIKNEPYPLLTLVSESMGTYHTAKDVDKIDCIDLELFYSAEYLINILRARTFPPYKGAYFEKDGKRYYMRLEIIPEEEFEKDAK